MTNNTSVNDAVNYYEKFHAYLAELFENYTKLSALLSQKLSAISRFDIATLDSIIKEEQVFVLLARGFDTNLQLYREKLNLKGENLSSVIMELPVEYKPDFQIVFASLKSKLDEVRLLNEKCQSLIEERIYCLERSINQLDRSNTTNYGKTGAAKPSADGRRMLQKSI